ncbi:hypothetical protein FA95DRAFT_1491766 [Auriscalpium vulgare]|uniref:Uncharacterized protein n=1 Tax=Auriscalpium vulgare TaxID=40419 RepID=A0ACB8RVS7_9AGAM|nr:hypothetical protein FA95DRAFT_1491766 [Auriscalpium vulgare]
MAPRSRARCQICDTAESKYSCPSCAILYCSVPCYKKHKEPVRVLLHRHWVRTSLPANPKAPISSHPGSDDDFAEKPPLRPLTSLNWPYVPDESAYPDPLKRDDPKPLQLRQYESIATAPAIRAALAAHPRLKPLLASLDTLRGGAREDALQRALGVSVADARAEPGGDRAPRVVGEYVLQDGDRDALRRLAEAVEAAVRGGQQSVLGLDWGDTENDM